MENGVRYAYVGNVLPWNLKREIAGQMNQIAAWGGKFVIAIPELEVFAA